MSQYITTPIYYVNATPHLGHAYTTIAADVLARYHRMSGEDTFFLTGTDEHGNKIAQAARDAGLAPRQFTDRVSAQFRELLPLLDATPDFFIRTTDPEHVRFVQGIWEQLRAAGDIYEETYSGPYCTACEAYYSEDELLEGSICPIHKQGIDVLNEKNYFFRLSRYQDRLLAFFDDNPGWIEPKSRYNEARSFIAGGLRDISVSRSSITWGVPVPWDESQVSYVWVDALFNYRSALTYARGEDLSDVFWPPAVQILGKDILKFHAVIWPALLMSVGMELPRKLFIHGFLMMGGDKMSKTQGNVFDPLPVIERYGPDPVRFYVLREVQFGQDGSVSMEGFEQRYNSELANDLGNLLSRTAAMLGKYVDGGTVPAAPAGDTIATFARDTCSAWAKRMEAIDLTGALEVTWTLVRRLNRHVEERAPWKLAKDPASADELTATLAELSEGLVAVASMLWPFMPSTSLSIAGAFGVTSEELAHWTWGMAFARTIKPVGSLFPRIESPVVS